MFNRLIKMKTCEKRIDEHLKGRREDIKKYMNATDLEEPEDEDLPSFYNYGLDFSLVVENTFEDQDQAYYRYQFSWGGPSDELRFYKDGTIEYWFKDWFDGAVRDVTGKDWAEWLKDWFKGCGVLEF